MRAAYPPYITFTVSSTYRPYRTLAMMLIGGCNLVPSEVTRFALVCRAEHRRFCWDKPEGTRHGCRASVGGQDALSTDPRHN